MRRTRIFYAETYPKQLETPVRAYEFKVTQLVVGLRSDRQILEIDDGTLVSYLDSDSIFEGILDVLQKKVHQETTLKREECTREDCRQKSCQKHVEHSCIVPGRPPHPPL